MNRRDFCYTECTKKALDLCFKAHKDQLDKSGLPYVFHPFHLAEQMDGEDAVCTALLHDVMEDSDYTEENLRNAGFSEEILEALKLLTHEEGVPYMEYIRKLSKNPLARAVKLADLRHNSDLNRLETITEWDLKRARKYADARAYLEQIILEENQ